MILKLIWGAICALIFFVGYGIVVFFELNPPWPSITGAIAAIIIWLIIEVFIWEK